MPLLCLEDDHFLNAKMGYTKWGLRLGFRVYTKYSHEFGSIVGFAIVVNI
jgi:hypothetical protein